MCLTKTSLMFHRTRGGGYFTRPGTFAWYHFFFNAHSDSVSQTQSYSIRVEAPHTIPQNLIAKVKIVKTSKSISATLPKESVLSDETQTESWVMKLINDSTAVKVPVKNGIETGDTM